MNEYDIVNVDTPAQVTEMYQDIDEDYKIDNLDTSYFDDTTRNGEPSCPRLKTVFPLLCKNFNLYYATREIGGMSEYDFFCMMQSCLNRNADTFERQLAVYDDDIANPILGRTEEVIYNTTDKRDGSGTSSMHYGLKTERSNTGKEIDHHIEVPRDADDSQANPFDRDRTRDILEFENRKTTDENSGTDTGSNTTNDTRKMTGTVTTKLSDLGVRPNYESLNGFLDENRTFIQEFINKFEECFSPRYRRVFF